MSLFTDGNEAVDMDIYLDKKDDESFVPIIITDEVVASAMLPKVYDVEANQAFFVDSVDALTDWAADFCAGNTTDTSEYSFAYNKINFKLSESDDESEDVLYTRSIAANILDMVEDVLNRFHIKVPSPEDDERDVEDDAGLYGTTYYDLLDKVESYIYSIVEKCSRIKCKVVPNKYCE